MISRTKRRRKDRGGWAAATAVVAFTVTLISLYIFGIAWWLIMFHHHLGHQVPSQPAVKHRHWFVQPCKTGFHDYNFSQTNGCYFHPDHGRPHCHFQNLQISLEKVSSVRLGGESLSATTTTTITSSSDGRQGADNKGNGPVLGQPENFEELHYEPQSFLFSKVPFPFASLDDDGPQSSVTFVSGRPTPLHYINDILVNAGLQQQPNICPIVTVHNGEGNNVATLQGLTLLVARASYANFYHAMQLWWNAFFALYPSQDAAATVATATTSWNASTALHLVFLDAHPYTSLDKVWSRLFAKVTYLQRDYHFNRLNANIGGGGGAAGSFATLPKYLCIENARLIPPGSNAPFAVAGKNAEFWQQCPNPSMTRRFVDFVLDKYQLKNVKQIPGRVVVIDRVPYLAHPRVKLGTIERGILGLASVARQEFQRAAWLPNFSLEISTFVNQSMAEQIQTIRQAQILIGIHGAGLTHLLFLHHYPKNAYVLEVSCQQNYFRRLAEWTGTVKHKCLKHIRSGISNDELAEYWKSEVIPIVQKVWTA